MVNVSFRSKPVFHSLPAVFHSLPAVFHSLPVVFHSLPLVFHSLPAVFHSLPAVFHSLPAVFHSLPAVDPEPLLISKLELFITTGNNFQLLTIIVKISSEFLSLRVTTKCDFLNSRLTISTWPPKMAISSVKILDKF